MFTLVWYSRNDAARHVVPFGAPEVAFDFAKTIPNAIWFLCSPSGSVTRGRT